MIKGKQKMPLLVILLTNTQKKLTEKVNLIVGSLIILAGNTKGGSITVPLISGLTGLESAI
jgi:hypothetical protein